MFLWMNVEVMAMFTSADSLNKGVASLIVCMKTASFKLYADAQRSNDEAEFAY